MESRPQTVRLELCDNCSPEGGKSHRGAPKTAFSKPPDGSWTPGGAHLAANVARKLTLGSPGGVLGALLAALGAVLKPLEPLLGRPGPLLGASWRSFWASQGLIWTFWTMSVALREIQQKPCILRCFWLPWHRGLRVLWCFWLPQHMGSACLLCFHDFF